MPTSAQHSIQGAMHHSRSLPGISSHLQCTAALSVPLTSFRSPPHKRTQLHCTPFHSLHECPTVSALDLTGSQRLRGFANRLAAGTAGAGLRGESVSRPTADRFTWFPASGHSARHPPTAAVGLLAVWRWQSPRCRKQHTEVV